MHLSQHALQVLQILVVLTSFVPFICGLDQCPSGSLVLSRGLTPEYEKDALNAHISHRQMLVDGVVPNQPRAKYMKPMTYDAILAKKCVPISDQCIMNHLNVTDNRWHCIGQNIYISWNSRFDLLQNWTAAVESWFWECNDFKYPNIAINYRQIGHYTQVAWADTDTVGCDFILFIDPKQPMTPFCKMYTCNYAPCGNFNNYPPYKLVTDPDDPSPPEYTKRCDTASAEAEAKKNKLAEILAKFGIHMRPS